MIKARDKSMDKALNEDQRVFEDIWNYASKEMVVLPDSVWASPASVPQQVLKLVTEELDDYGLVFATRDSLGGRIVVLTDRYALDGSGNIVIHAPVGGRELLLHAPPIDACVTTRFSANIGRALCACYRIDIEETVWKNKPTNRNHVATCGGGTRLNTLDGRLRELYLAC